MANIKSTEDAKKAIIDKIAAKLACRTPNALYAVRHSNHGSAHASHGSRGFH